MRYYTLILPQNGGNRVSEGLKFQNFPREEAIETPLLKTSIPRQGLPVWWHDHLFELGPVYKQVG